jgi:hypothetical protein
VVVARKVDDHQVSLGDVLEDGGTSIDTDDRGRLQLPMDGYGYRWLRVVPVGEVGQS